MKHVMPENHHCPKVIYVDYIRKTWLIKHGQNLSTGKYIIVCETCGYVSDFPTLIELAGTELESHLQNNEKCLQSKRIFLEEFISEPIQKDKVKSSISIDPDRKLWACSYCRPVRKFTNRDEYIAHHFMHN